jgi:hypothetical protein
MTTMSHDDLRNRFEERLSEAPAPPLERARSFLTYYVHDSDPELLEIDAKRSPADVSNGVQAIEELIAAPRDPGILSELVLHDANRVLDDDSDDTAAVWLRRLVHQLREWLGDDAPPPQDG